jgi:hypothetical protein
MGSDGCHLHYGELNTTGNVNISQNLGIKFPKRDWELGGMIDCRS